MSCHTTREKFSYMYVDDVWKVYQDCFMLIIKGESNFAEHFMKLH